MLNSKKEINYFPISEDIEILDALPILFIKDIKALVIADVHLGIESIMAEEGVTFFGSQTEKIIETILFYIKKIKPSTLIFNGDLKHSFNEPTKIENREVKKCLEALSFFVKRIIIVKGNHDVFLSWVTRDLPNCDLLENFTIGRYFFTHGHKNLPDSLPRDVEFIIIGHEHPLFYSKIYELQVVKQKAFLMGHLYKKTGESTKLIKIIVLPAFSFSFGGNIFNPKEPSSLLSPILRDGVDLLEFEAFVLLEKEKEVLRFPPFKDWY